MVRRNDTVYTLILVLILVIAFFIGISIVKGVLLFLFSGVLIYNAILKFKFMKTVKLSKCIFYGVFLSLNILLAAGAIAVIVSAVL